MARIVYVNGKYVDEKNAKISVFDRGFLMADGVYEVTTVMDGKLIDFEGHMKRLSRSLHELEMKAPCSDDELLSIHRELIKRNKITEGLVYLQVTRGVAERDFEYPMDTKPTLVLFTQSKKIVDSISAKRGLKVISIDDLRWERRDIKTIQLLYPSMGKMMAKAAGCDDAWLVEDGFVTEGTSNNAYIVKDGVIITRQLGNEVLSGITRNAILRFAKEAQMKVEERCFTIIEAQNSDEAFISSASTFVTPVVEIDGVAIGSGSVGPITTRLREIYIEEMRKSAL